MYLVGKRNRKWKIELKFARVCFSALEQKRRKKGGQIACPFPRTLEVFIRIQLSEPHTKKIERKSTASSKIASKNADHPLHPIPHSLFVLSLSEPFFEVPLYRHGCAGTWRREIVFEMNCRSSWSYRLRVHRTLSTSSQPASSPLYTFPETPSSSGISPLASRSPGYTLRALSNLLPFLLF